MDWFPSGSVAWQVKQKATDYFIRVAIHMTDLLEYLDYKCQA